MRRMALRFQLRLRNMLLATLWVAVWLGAYVARERVLFLEVEMGGQYPKQHVLLTVLAVVPFTAVGALFGKAWKATLYPIAILLTLLIWDWLFVPDVVY